MRIGVDLGGTKTEIIVLDPTGRERYRQRSPTPTNYNGSIRNICELATAAEQAVGQKCRIGICIPGTVSPATGLIKNANSTWLNGKPLDKDLAHSLERPLRVANDANCFAVSEASDGAAAGAHCVFGVIIGTGCGGGIAIAGQALVGPNAVAGEWGHNQLPWMSPEETPGPDCYCGKNGCLETFLSGPGMANDHLASTGQSLTAEQIVAAAADGNAAAEATLARHEDRLARGLASVINVLDPDAIVLGGGLSNIRRLYRTVPQIWSRYAFSDEVDTPLVPPVHGDSSGVRGAAWLWPAGDGDWQGN